jgi:hypothetical protein
MAGHPAKGRAASAEEHSFDHNSLDHHRGASMETRFENLREYLDSDYARLPDRRIEALMESHGMDAEAMESFFSSLGNIAKSVGQVALKAAPSIVSVAAPLVGTALGGPIGGAIGGQLGSLASGALASATGQRPPAPGGGGGVGQLIGGLTGGSAAGKLLQNFLNPSTLGAVGSMALGALGKDSQTVGGRDVPVAGFLNMLKTFLGNAEAEYNAAQAASNAALPEYLQDFAGQAAGDTANEQFRALRLEALLESESEAAEAVEASEGSEAEALEGWEAEYEALELAEMESEALESEGFESEGIGSEGFESEVFEAEAGWA